MEGKYHCRGASYCCQNPNPRGGGEKGWAGQDCSAVNTVSRDGQAEKWLVQVHSKHAGPDVSLGSQRTGISDIWWIANTQISRKEIDEFLSGRGGKMARLWEDWYPALSANQTLTNVKKEGSRDHQPTIEGVSCVPKAVIFGTLPKLRDSLASIKWRLDLP